MADKSAAEVAKAKAEREAKKVDAFKKLANTRVSAVLGGMTKVAALSSKGSYSYTAEQVAKIEKALTDKLTETVAAFKTGAPSAGGFSLD